MKRALAMAKMRMPAAPDIRRPYLQLSIGLCYGAFGRKVNKSQQHQRVISANSSELSRCVSLVT